MRDIRLGIFELSKDALSKPYIENVLKHKYNYHPTMPEDSYNDYILVHNRARSQILA